jgi:uncharacterized membrane protein (DUF106 family)
MSIVNALLRPIFDILLSPFRSLPAIVSLTLVSLLVSIFMLLVYKRASNQEQLAAVKRRIHAGLFEIRLFNDDLRAILRAQGAILRANGRYLALSFLPMVWILPPLVLVMAELEFHYAYRGLAPGECAVVSADLRPEARATLRPDATLDAPAGVSVETPALWMPSTSQVAWRIRAEREGEYDLTLRVAGAPPVTKSLRVARTVARRSPVRVDGSFWDQLLYPAESPLPASAPFAKIRVSYPAADVRIFGFGLHWMVPFFVLSIVFAFALKGIFKVTL